MDGKNQNTQEKQAWYSLAFIWAGSMICIPSLMIGGTLINNMNFPKALLVGLIGYAIIVVLMILQGIQSSDLGKPTVQVASQAFGETGAQKVISLILAIACLGWFGIQTNVCGQAFTSLMAAYGVNIPVWLSSFIWGMIMLVSAIYGIKVIRALSYVAVPYLVVVCLYGLYQALTSDNAVALQHYQPSSTMSLMDGMAITMGSFALGAVIAGDYSQYSTKRSDVVKAATFGILPAGILMIAVGAVLTIVYKGADINGVFMQIGSPLIGGLALILASWKMNAVNAFSGGIAIINIFNIQKKHQNKIVALAGIIGTILAIVGILNYFVPIMSLLSAMIPPVAGVMIAAYWVVQKGDKYAWKPVVGVNWLGVISWAIGAVVACLPVVVSFFPNLPQIKNQPILGIVLSFAIYYFGHVLMTLKNTKSINSEKE